MPRDAFAQTMVAGRMTVHAAAHGLVLAQDTRHQAPPRLVRKQRRIRKTGAKVEFRGLIEGGGHRQAVPDAPRAQHARSAALSVNWSGRRRPLADKRSG